MNILDRMKSFVVKDTTSTAIALSTSTALVKSDVLTPPPSAQYSQETIELARAITKVDAPTASSNLSPLLQSRIQRDRKSTRLNSSHIPLSRMPSSA